ncbi:hypothetical protein [Pseudomonas helleri]|uniref:hypothetical protein n=1 Tax=Pseudomonas helleri TaxID=1608996 RepID=UPI00242FA84F|nr:hypothetical protein [Pseudomonas helleri]
MVKVSKHTELSETLTLSECTDGFWLYDYTRGFNLAMRAKTEQEAFVEALSYYQDRLSELERAHKCLDSRVKDFVSQFAEVED